MTLPKIIRDNPKAWLIESAIDGYLALANQRDYERRNAEHLHEEIDAALGAIDELQTRLRTIEQTAGLFTFDGIDTTSASNEVHATQEKFLEGLPEKLTREFLQGKKLQEQRMRLHGTRQRLKEIAGLFPHKKHRPDKILESELEHRIAYLCTKFGISKRETEIALDEIFNELGISRVDKKTLRDNTKGITYGEGKR